MKLRLAGLKLDDPEDWHSAPAKNQAKSSEEDRIDDLHSVNYDRWNL